MGRIDGVMVQEGERALVLVDYRTGCFSSDDFAEYAVFQARPLGGFVSDSSEKSWLITEMWVVTYCSSSSGWSPPSLDYALSCCKFSQSFSTNPEDCCRAA